MDAFKKIEIHQVNFEIKDQVFIALKDVKIMFHVNSPETSTDFSIPSLLAQKNIIQACEEFNIKKLIVTSTIQTICGKYHHRDDS